MEPDTSLPAGWSFATLGSLGKWGSGGTPKRGVASYYGGSIPWLKIGDLTDGPVSEASEHITDEGLRNSSAKVVEPGALLVAMYGSIGKLGITANRLAMNQAIAYCIPDERLTSSDFLFWLLRYLRPVLVAEGKGGNQSNISQTVLKSLKVPLPPKEAQRAIVDLIQGADTAKRRAGMRLIAAIGALDRFRQTVLAAAFTGRLTADWRAQQGLQDTDGPSGWMNLPVEDCVDVLDNQRRPVNSAERERRRGPIPYYGATGQVGWIDGFLFDEELVLVGEDGAPFLDKSKPIAYIIRGKSWVNNHAHVLRARSEITSNEYIKFYLDAFDFTEFVQGSTRDKLTQRAMNSIPVHLAPLAEQAEMVSRIKRLFADADRLMQRVDAAAVRIERSSRALLSRAFRGQLLDGGDTL